MGTGLWGRRRASWRPLPLQLQEANAQLAEQACPHDVEMTPVQRRIEPRSADDSLSGVVRCLYFADTFLRDGEMGGWAGEWASAGHLGHVGGGHCNFQEAGKPTACCLELVPQAHLVPGAFVHSSQEHLLRLGVGSASSQALLGILLTGLPVPGFARGAPRPGVIFISGILCPMALLTGRGSPPYCVLLSL